MPERSYFSYRYAIPGYTFILLVMAINYVPLYKILIILACHGIESTFGAFLGFISLLSGSALGFMISQFWWRWFQFRGGEFSSAPRATNALINKYKLIRCDKIEDKKEAAACKEKVIPVSDYVMHSEREKQKGVFLYIERRWDMYHLLSTEFVTLIIGSFLGVFYRVLSHFLLFKSPLPSIQDIFRFWDTKFWLEWEFWVLVTIFTLVVVLGYKLRKGSGWVKAQHDAVSEALIRRAKIEPATLAETFPADCFNTAIIEGINNKEAEKLEDAGIFSVSHLARANPKELSQKIVNYKEDIPKWIDKAKEFMKQVS